MDNIQLAQKALENANYSDCFEYLDKLTLNPEQKTLLNKLRMEFVSGATWDFWIRLGDFIKTLNSA